MLMIEARIGELLPSPGQAVIGEGAVRVQGSGARGKNCVTRDRIFGCSMAS